MSIDLYSFHIINRLAGKWKFLDFLGIFFAKYFGYILLFCLMLFLVKDLIIRFYSRETRYWRMVMEAFFAAVFVRFVLTEIIRIIWFRPRPFVLNDVNLLIPYNFSEASFPSGHASFYFALSTVIYSYNKKAGIVFYSASFLISISRVFVGVHWPSDIFAGIILGVVIGLILNKIFKKIHLLKFLEKFK